MFKIVDCVEFDATGRAVCPSCEKDGKGKKKNLALIPNSDGAYKCHRGCSPEDIRAALGQEKPKQVPKSQAEPVKRVAVSPQKVAQSHERLLNHKQAMGWLANRGITEEIAKRHKLGLTTCKVGRRRADAITIYIPANPDRTAYYQKKRVAPWDPEITQDENYQAWKQYGVPSMVYFTHKPEGAKSTWLCEGEWDAILLADRVRNSTMEGISVAVASFTSGCKSVPPKAETDRLPGTIYCWYDRNDKPLKDGTLPGDEGAKAVAKRLGDRVLIAQVPMDEDCDRNGWDVSDAINSGRGLANFVRAAVEAKPAPKELEPNKIRDALRWNGELIDSAPDYTEFLVPDLLTEDELFVLAAPPRAGKSLLAMELARCVASGDQFMGRPCTQGTVVYVKCEDSDTKIKERQEAQGWEKSLPVAWLDKFKLGDVDLLEEVVKEIDARLVILDTLSRIKDGPISESSAEMSQLLEPLQVMANRHGCCVVLVHHTGKVNADTASQQDIFDTIRGSSAIRAVCRGSLILAKGETSYRLVSENGWGKHDLKVSLDANTLRWQLLGEWNPPANQSQQERIIDVLKAKGSASVDEIYIRTGIKRNSIYKQLTRLMASPLAGEKVVKEGKKRNYTYRLALVDTVGQLNALSTSCPLGETQASQSIHHVSGQKSKKSKNSKDIGFSTPGSVTVDDVQISQNDSPNKHTDLSTKYTQTPDLDRVSTNGQLVDNLWTDSGQTPENGRPVSTENLSSSVTVASGPVFSIDQKVRILRPGSLSGQIVYVESIEDDLITVTRDSWAVSQIYPCDELEAV